MTEMTQNGVSTTSAPGSEKYETFTMGGKSRVQYDYRHTDGKLFTCVRPTLAECREARDRWLVQGKSRTRSVRIFTGGYGGFRFPLDGFRDEFYDLEKKLVVNSDRHDAVTDESDRRIWWTDDSTFIADVISCQVKGSTSEWPDGYEKFVRDACHDNPPAPDEMRTFVYLGQPVYAVGCEVLPTPAITDTMHSRE